MTLESLGNAVELSLDAPRPVARTWSEEARRLGTPEAMRGALSERYPALDATRLRRLAIVGAADEGRRLITLCQAHGIEVLAVADDDPKRRGEEVGGPTVGPVAALRAVDRDVPVVIASHRPLQSVQRMRAMGFDTVCLFCTLQVLAPETFAPHMFYDGWFEDLAAHGEAYARLADMFDDETSRQHLDAILGFRLTTDIGTLASVIDWDVYYPRDLVTLGEDEVYVDGGAFDGDSVRLFIERAGGKVTRVLAFEPDPATFARLSANFADDARIEPINRGLYERSDVLRFESDGSRAAILTDAGSAEIPVTSLDEVLDGARVTFVKMNIEGAELAALRGSAKSIARWAPRLAIAAYHRPTDLWRVPFLIKELRPSYRLALRQHDAGVIETVAYGL